MWFDRIRESTPTFGDGRKRNTLGSAWTPREEGRALAARDRLPRIHDTTRTVRPSRLPRHRHGAPGGMIPPHLWRGAGLRGRGGCPGEWNARCDGGIVIAEPTGKALHSLQRTRARPLQPRIEVLGLPLAHELEKVLREVDGLGDLGSLRVELGELLRLGLRTLRGTPQHQPGRPTGRQRGAHGFGHAWEGPPRAALARGEPLGLA